MTSRFSFRDPDGFLMESDGRLFRVVRRQRAARILEFLETPSARRLRDAGKLVETFPVREDLEREILENISSGAASYSRGYWAVLEHERIPFVSYPPEWPSEMLYDAAMLTLDLAALSVERHVSLKDATPYNVLFRGHSAVFVDVLSFEERDPLDPVWRPYGQFMRGFALPLLADRALGLGPDRTLSGRRDGVTPEEIYRLSGPLRRLFPPFLAMVTLPVWLAGPGNGGGPERFGPKRASDPAKALFILSSLFGRLKRGLATIEPRENRSSIWTGYEEDNVYRGEDAQKKEVFLRESLMREGAERVLDIGCNEGRYSMAAALTGASVTAIDSDPVVVGRLWRKARDRKLDILPLVVDLADPTPPAGWGNEERRSFLDRCRGSFDGVMMLATLHHLLVSAQIPLDAILDLLAGISRDLLVIEYVPPEDPMFRRIARGRENLFSWLDQRAFEGACARHFDITSSIRFEGNGRRLYAMRRKGRDA